MSVNTYDHDDLLEKILDALGGEVLAAQELVRVERALPVDVGKG